MVAISSVNRDQPPGGTGSGNPALIPAAPTNPYLSLTPEQLIIKARSFLRRSRQTPMASETPLQQQAIGQIRNALLEIPKGSEPYREAQRLLASLARMLRQSAPAEVQSDPQTRAEVYCLALKNAPEYLASSSGGEYRRQSNKLCDELRREVVRQVLHH
jgi:hypothetical protein